MKFQQIVESILLLCSLLTSNLYADESSDWEKLITKRGCLMSSTDINFTMAGSIFEKKDWQVFFEMARKDEKTFLYVISKFSSRRETEIHICNFKYATEGEVAVFVAQQIIRKNWYSYDGNDGGLRQMAGKNVVQKALLLNDILSDKIMCEALKKYFIEKYKLTKKCFFDGLCHE